MQIPLRYRLPCFRQGAFCLLRGFSRSCIPTASWKACTRRCAGTLGWEANAFSALAIARRHRSDTSHSTDSASPAAQIPAGRSLEAVRPLSNSHSASTCSSQKEALSSSASASLQPHPSNAHSQSFSQGLTEFRWREVSARTGVYVPSVLQAESVRNRVRLFGMPKGFPATTAVGFRRFFYLSQANSFIADFSACIGYQSLLSGFFLGSSPQMWMLKDLFPALIAAYMANRLVSYESRPKQWFCVSVLLRNLTIIADMVIPSALPQHMVLAAVANAVLKQSSALMFFITRAAALQHYATDNNLAELTKKFNSFSMVTFTLATALAIVYCTFLTSFAAQLTTILVCCAANMSLSYLAMSPIAFRILNGETMQVLLHTYVMERGRVMTPQMVSDLMGIHMSATAALKAGRTHTDVVPNLLYISPPIDKLIIRSDTLRDDVLYLDSRGAVLIALWQPSATPLTLQEVWRRYELPPFLRLLRSAFRSRREKRALAEMEKRFGGHRLCLLVHHKCTPRDLVTAYLIMYAAVLQHASTEAELRAFVRQCHAEQEVWRAKGDQLYEELKEAGWDVERPALDHHDFRLSDLVLQTPQRVEDC